VTLTDVHSHLVPGVDDGARTVDDALEGIARMVGVGIRRIVTTPHLEGRLTLDPGSFSARMDRVDRAWQALRAAVAERFPEVEIHRGFEVMLDTPDPDLSDPRVRLAGTEWVLVEWPRLQVPPGSTRAVARLVAAGVRPIIAHPERYTGTDETLDLAGEWRVEGALLQVNHGSLAGRYGPDARRRAMLLLRQGWADLLATDFHGRSHLHLYVKEAEEIVRGSGGSEQWRILTSLNPARIAQGGTPVPVPPLSLEDGLWRRMKTLFKGSSPDPRDMVED
jgi:protein-tyrosine phosphatase